jgi:hypothetical protein
MPVKGAAGPSVSRPLAAVKETGRCAGDRRRPCGEVCESAVLVSWRRWDAAQERGALAAARARSGPGWARLGPTFVLRAAAEASFFSWRGAVAGGARAATAALAALGALATARTDLGPIWNKAVAEATCRSSWHGVTASCWWVCSPFVAGQAGSLPRSRSIFSRVNGGRSFSSETAGYLPALVRPPRSLLGALVSPRWWSTCSSLSTSCLLRLLNACLARLRFAGVRCSARVKTLLGSASCGSQ